MTRRWNKDHERHVLVDISGLAYSAFFTKGELRYDGQMTGIAFGVVQDILKYGKQFKTNKFVFCYDSRKNYRKKIYPEYKGNRKTTIAPQDRKAIKDQVGTLREDILPSMGFNNNFMVTGYESDDLIAMLTRKYKSKLHLILSNDDDLVQLLDYHVDIFNFKKGQRYTREQFVEDTGLAPWWWAEMKAIAGCQSDNVKGLEGIGMKKALQWLQGDMNQATKTYKKINEGKDGEIVKRNRKLVHLPFKGPKRVRLVLRENELSKDRIIETFERLGFYSYLGKDKFSPWKKFLQL